MASWNNIKSVEKDKILESLDNLLKILNRKNKRLKTIKNVYKF